MSDSATARNQPTSLMSNIMMELRKCCNHPYLFPGAELAFLAPGGAASGKLPLEALIAASGKLALLDQMVSRLQAGGHRVLIYSQFTSVRISINISTSPSLSSPSPHQFLSPSTAFFAVHAINLRYLMRSAVMGQHSGVVAPRDSALFVKPHCRSDVRSCICCAE